MGERGPLKKPNAHRRRNEPPAEPTPEGEVIRPGHLSESQQAIWDLLAAILTPVGRLRAEDVVEFEVLVCAVDDFRRAREMVDKYGPLIMVDGTPAENPALRVSTQQAKLVTAVGAKFGLSPADRERAKSAGAPAKSRADERLRGSGNRPRRTTGQSPPLKVVAND